MTYLKHWLASRKPRDPAKAERDSKIEYPPLAIKTPKALVTVKLGRSLRRRRIR
jgi:hypothetical protein